MIKTKARACTGKIKHATRKAALKHLANLVAAGASPVVLVAYRCPADPSHHHVGHRIPARRK